MMRTLDVAGVDVVCEQSRTLPNTLPKVKSQQGQLKNHAIYYKLGSDGSAPADQQRADNDHAAILS